MQADLFFSEVVEKAIQRKEEAIVKKEEVAFIGLGGMGQAMAFRLLGAGYRLQLWNRTQEKGKALVGDGARLFATPEEAVRGVGLVITMLADDVALEQVVSGPGGFLAALPEGGIHLSMSTVSPEISRRLAERHQEGGSHYLGAPVFGRPEAAREGKLWICVSGDPPAKERVRSLLEILGQGCFDFGPRPEAAHVVKLVGNFLIGAATEALAEAFALAEKNGLDRSQVAEMLLSTIFACPIYRTYGGRLAQHRYRPVGFRLPLGLKDVSLVRDLARASQAPVPMADLVHNRFLTALAKDRLDLDMTALGLGALEDAGLPLPKSLGSA